MSDEQTLTHAEISRRIVTGMGLVYDLYNELNGLLRMILEGLMSSDLETDVVRVKAFKLPLPHGKARTPADSMLLLDRGFIMELGVAGGEDEETDDQDEQDEDEESEAKSQQNRRQITPDSQFLAIRAVLYDPKQTKNKEFAPAIVGATLAEMKRVPKSRLAPSKKATGNFQAQKSHLLWLTQSLDPTVAQGDTISCRIAKYELLAKVTNIQSRPLAEFDSEDAVNSFVAELVAMAENAEA